ncbi:probable dolichyl pyrophosphate Glc1Man9GlcNAc2 alpha-1,3-glucosyltransferase [Mya arenaria]|uniref:probable dolichyl pyrophosphate Glc1Man9GlcNAc2 alpha-1,3-glucosyltransferase n=1 Tax=Mya arenaria TaxID=6604 RepID=UPI0022DF3501|nr:probable dolichyl pyrophosphate Glc1Man9GlcNAc2 alpha-1,3-glucosyltransferase [Mya arenaria]
MAAYVVLAATVSLFKLLTLRSYKSTDFDVHRNWLAITHSLPVRRWYFEDTSQWTLDYPPFFAWFEYALSQFAGWFDKEMLKVENVNYRSPATILFQQLTVILTDFVYIYAVKEIYQYFRSIQAKTADLENIFQSSSLVQAVILLTNFGLFIVDHIHFQYNGFLFGILLLSIVRMYQDRHMSAAFWFALLLNLKHLYLYVAPAYFVYLLRCYVFQNKSDGSIDWQSLSIMRLLGLGGTVISVFTLSLGPFIMLGQIPQLVTRLFPFKRGLCHAYWAPNFWALYNVADKMASVAGTRLGFVPPGNQTVSMTGGLVREFDHTFLPSVSPLATLVLSGLSMMPSLLMLWARPRGPQSFVRALILCGFGSFMFGWHVHEKAILMIIIPMGLLILERKTDASLFLVMSTVGHYSLFPLLFTQCETPIKIGLLLLTTIYAFSSFSNMYKASGGPTRLPLLSFIETLYLLGLLPLEVYTSLVHPLIGLSQPLPFLPLLLTSVYTSVGVTYCWFRFYLNTYMEQEMSRSSKLEKID